MNIDSYSKKHHWNKGIIKRARELKTNGLSYGEISQKLGVAKSTLFSWVSDIKNINYITKEDRIKHLKSIQIKAVEAIKKKRLSRLKILSEFVNRDVEKFNTKDTNCLKSMLAMLYWAEGSKGRGLVSFANTDPDLTLLFVTLLRKCYSLDESKFRVRLHLHAYHNVEKTVDYWSTLLKIPKAKFGKIYIKQRSRTRKFRKNFAGICFVRYYSEDLRYQLLETGKVISKRICACSLTG